MSTKNLAFLVLVGVMFVKVEEAVTHNQQTLATATFAGGCFWCMEPPFEKQKGVIGVVSGYTGGQEENPTYEQVGSGATGHLEAIRVSYDPTQVSYEDLLEIFWRNVDPTDSGGQFVDRGLQYRTAIFFHNEEQKKLAEASRKKTDASGRFERPVITPILPLGKFYPAEDYHQDYWKRNPIRYQFYRSRSGRDQFLKKIWPESTESKNELRKRLNPMQYHVTQEAGTEPPFQNEYWNNKREGIYVDVVSGEPLFSSKDKFDSGTGWPSFRRPLVAENIVQREDRKFFATRIEVRSRKGNSHLGHLFTDGPTPAGLRYCINSAALRFIPKENLEKEGYGDQSHP